MNVWPEQRYQQRYVQLNTGPTQVDTVKSDSRARWATFRHILHPAGGAYTAVMLGLDLGPNTVNLNDGSYSTTKIFAVSGLPEEVIGHGNGHTKKAIGDFYAVRRQFRRLRD